jgi:hypothetical protein
MPMRHIWSGVDNTVRECKLGYKPTHKSKKDSDVIHLTVPGKDIFVVNCLDVAVELFGKPFVSESERFVI